MPGATVARLALPTAPMLWKASMMPHTVPKSPTKGLTAATVASNPRLRSNRPISTTEARCSDRSRDSMRRTCMRPSVPTFNW